MMKFASFETIVEMIYGYMPGKKSDYGRGTQTAVSFAGGYAGTPSRLPAIPLKSNMIQPVFFVPPCPTQQT